MSWQTPKMSNSESRKGLLSSPKTLLATPSTVNGQDRLGQSPEVRHDGGRMLNLDEDDIDNLRQPSRKSKFHTFPRTADQGRRAERLSYDDWEANLDRDQVLQPDYGRAEHISSLFQTKPMLNLYSDNAANMSPFAQTPIESPSAPPRLSGGAAQTPFYSGGGLGEDDEVDLRPPPSVHDPHVSNEKARVETLRRKLEAERVSADSTETVEMNSSIAMHEQLAKIFDVQMQLADMHAQMEGIHETPKAEANADLATENGLDSSPRTPFLSPLSNPSSSPRMQKSPKLNIDTLGKDYAESAQQGNDHEAANKSTVKRDHQIDDIVGKVGSTTVQFDACSPDQSSTGTDIPFLHSSPTCRRFYINFTPCLSRIWIQPSRPLLLLLHHSLDRRRRNHLESGPRRDWSQRNEWLDDIKIWLHT
jgi:hypothetical protein